MAGSTALAPMDIGVLIPLSVQVAAETLAAEQVVHEFLGCLGNRGTVRYLQKGRQGRFYAKMLPHSIDSLVQGKMIRLGAPLHPFLMTSAADRLHGSRGPRSGKEALVGCILIAGVVISLMALGTGKVVGGIQLDILMAADTTGFLHCQGLWYAFLSRRRTVLQVLIFPTAS